MGVSLDTVPVYFLAVLLCAKSQLYGQYGYTPYGQYFPGQNPVYNPYPYQPYVSSQSIPYAPYYGYPLQSYAPQNYPVYDYPAQTYPAQTYPAQTYPAGSYPSQTYDIQNYPVQQNYPSVYPQFTRAASNPVPYPYINNGSRKLNETETDPYADLKVDIIDIEPKYFNYYKRYFNLEDNTYPVDVIDNTDGGTAPLQSQTQPYYTVKSESKSFNFSSVPQTINTHDVKSKTYSFKRTFTVDPNKKDSAVINLNFVNGVQVTTTQEPNELGDQAETTVMLEVKEEAVSTTTESEEPSNILSWI